jgi:hypothetical protein
MSEGLPGATTVSRCCQGSEENSCNLCSRYFERLHDRELERRTERETFVLKVQWCFAWDPSDAIRKDVLRNAISRHWKEKKQVEISFQETLINENIFFQILCPIFFEEGKLGMTFRWNGYLFLSNEKNKNNLRRNSKRLKIWRWYVRFLINLFMNEGIQEDRPLP